MRLKSWRTFGIVMVAIGVVIGGFAVAKLWNQDPAAATVQRYLQAIAANDSAAALALIETPPTGPLLSNEALKAATATAAITEIATKDQSEVDQTVYATYKLGNLTATQLFPVVKTDSGWRIKRGTATLTVANTVGALPISVNGVAVKPGETLDVFPGNYTVASTTDIVTLTNASAMVKLLDAKYSIAPEVTLTEAGQAKVIAEAKKSLANCLATQEITKKECPNQVKPGVNVVVDKKTIKWSLKNDPFQDVKFQAATGDAKGVEAVLNMEFNLKLNFSDDGDRQAGNQDIKYEKVRCVVDITTDPMTVSWPR